ncbi:hypothetical protein GCM10010149_89030 [Nonomuraea roseoviolacea subsp. roseoviolacea]
MDVEQKTREIASGDLGSFTNKELEEVVRAFAEMRHALADQDAIYEMAMAPFVQALRDRNVKSLAVSRMMRREGLEPNSAPVTRILTKWRKLTSAAQRMEQGELVDRDEARLVAVVQQVAIESRTAASDPRLSQEARRRAERDRVIVATWFDRVFGRASASGLAIPGLLAAILGQKAGGAAAGGTAAAAGGTAAGGATAAAVGGTTTAAVAATGTAATVGTSAVGTVAGLAMGTKAAIGVGALLTTTVIVVAADPVPTPTADRPTVVAESRRPTPRSSPTATWTPPPPFISVTPGELHPSTSPEPSATTEPTAASTTKGPETLATQVVHQTETQAPMPQVTVSEPVKTSVPMHTTEVVVAEKTQEPVKTKEPTPPPMTVTPTVLVTEVGPSPTESPTGPETATPAPSRIEQSPDRAEPSPDPTPPPTTDEPRPEPTPTVAPVPTPTDSPPPGPLPSVEIPIVGPIVGNLSAMLVSP